ncbi:MAG: 50S ribosomal protein L22 [Blastocatellia bacterium]|nr:50S ribosomal protein L22 [Chloracidobacterium sp.]MBL8184301.1 50S ribosomal protein L22 [Blastocatellia bacterium]HBE82817.1 50S ribosomal protein L22 [Blastocatellia bacterium]
MEAIAKTKYLKGSPRKARLVIDLIRGRNVSQALSILKFTDKRAAQPIAQCLNSAIANATYLAEKQNIAIDPDDLWVKTCFVDMGPTKNRRRMRPAPQGRAYREQRHYCHITIEVTSDDKPKTEKELKAEAAKAKRAEAPKKPKAEKKEAPKTGKKAKAEKVDELETPIAEEALDTSSEVAANIDATGNAEVADAKNVQTQTTAALDETKPADQVQLDRNEELERQ